MNDTGLEASAPINWAESGCCEYAKKGRGDCENSVGLPGKSIPDQHDGGDDTVDAYGKPNGWCWQCWKSKQIQELQDQKSDLLEALRIIAGEPIGDVEWNDSKILDEIERIAKAAIAKAEPHKADDHG